MCSLWQGLSDGIINFERVTLTVTFDLLFKNFNIAPANLHNARPDFVSILVDYRNGIYKLHKEIRVYLFQDTRMVDPNFIKLFKLAQLTIEYLLVRLICQTFIVKAL